MSEYGVALGARLRVVRRQQGLSLSAVEERSSGRWKAVVIGSYERGDRALTLEKLVHLASFYNIPVTELLPEVRPTRGGEPATKLVLNLQRLATLPEADRGPLVRFVATIQSLRGDYNGRVLSLRSGDLAALSVMYDMDPGALTDQLIVWGVLVPDARPDPDAIAARLRQDIDGNIRLEQATGILAERTGLQIGQALELLRAYARDRDLPMDIVAADICTGSVEHIPGITEGTRRAAQ